MVNKFKVTIDNFTLSELQKDMLEYGVRKNNNEINKNDFYCKVIISMFYHREKLRNAYKNIFVNYTDDKQKIEDLATDTIDFQNNVHNPYIGYSTSSIIIYTNKQNTDILNDIAVKSYQDSNTSISAFFRSLLEEYVNKKAIEKERILFSKEILKLNLASENSKIIEIMYENKKYIIAPEFAFDDFNKNHIYLYGIDISNNNPLAFKVSKIKNIFVSNKHFYNIWDDSINSEDRYSSGYLDTTDELVEIEYSLTQKGKEKVLLNNKLFKYNINHEIDKDIYNIKATEEFFFNYFVSFGKDINIIKPISLKNKFINFYKESIE